MERTNEQEAMFQQELSQVRTLQQQISQSMQMYMAGRESGQHTNELIGQFKNLITNFEKKWQVELEYQEVAFVKVRQPQVTLVQNQKEDVPFIQRKPNESQKVVEQKSIQESTKKEAVNQKFEKEHQNPNGTDNRIPKQEQNQNNASTPKQSVNWQQAFNEQKIILNDTVRSLQEAEKVISNLQHDLKKAEIDKERFLKALRMACKTVAKNHTEKNADGWFKEYVSETYVVELNKKKEDVH